MPVVSVNRSKLFHYLGQEYTDEEFTELLFDFGLELDEITSNKEIEMKEKGVDTTHLKIKKDEVVYKIETPANRYDLLCLEGLVYSLLIFLQKKTAPKIRVTQASNNKTEKLYITKNPSVIRPYMVAAILRNFEFKDEAAYLSFIDYQDRLHQTIARKRTLLSIGTHDYDTVKGPLIYDAKSPKDIVFIPLNQSTPYSAEQLMELYNKESHLKPYLHIIKDSPLYPVFLDSVGTVLSFPPIVNSEHSKITLKTKNILIDCSATDLHKAKIAVEYLSAIFSIYCARPYEVEAVQIIDEVTQKSFIFPEFKYREELLPIDQTNTLIGLKCEKEEIKRYLMRMGYHVKNQSQDPKYQNNSSNYVVLDVPPLRSDVLHIRDIMEDIAIAYGINKIPATYPRTPTIAMQVPLNKFCEILRSEIVGMGYTEVLTFTLCSSDDVYRKMRKPAEENDACVIANPKTQDFEVVRTSLMPGILKVIASNKNVPLPLKLFEISDIVLKDGQAEVGARNQRNLCIIRYAKTGGSGFELIHGALDRIMKICGCERLFLPQSTKDCIASNGDNGLICEPIINGIDGKIQKGDKTIQALSNGLSEGDPLEVQLVENTELIHNSCKSTNINPLCYTQNELEKSMLNDEVTLHEHIKEMKLLDKSNSTHNDMLTNLELGKPMYMIVPGTNPSYFEGRCASILLYNHQDPNQHFCLGHFGILHPEVVKSFDLTLPVSALEIDLQCLIWYCYGL